MESGMFTNQCHGQILGIQLRRLQKIRITKQKLCCQLIPYLALSLFLNPCHCSRDIQLVMEISSGVYISELPSSSIFYSSVAPIVYMFSVPQWTLSDLSLPMGSNCTSAQWTEGSTCPVKFYLPEVQNRFTEYILDNQPLVNRFERMGASPQQSEIQFECDVLEKHFQDIYIDSGVIERYLAKLKRCSPAGDFDFFRDISSYKYNISDVYLSMRQGFFSEVWMKVHDGRIDAGLWTNALNVLHALNFANYQMEVNRWRFALSECTSGRIPSSVVTPELLGDSLQDLFDNLSPSGLVPLISSPDVGNYFKNQLADCTFSNDSLVIRVLVPVVQAHRSYTLYSLTSGTFFHKSNQLCQIPLQNSVVLMDNLERVAYDTDCKPNTFCHVPTITSPKKVNPCASALLNKELQDIVKYCNLECTPISPYHLRKGNRSAGYRLQQIRADKFLITGTSTDKFKLNFDLEIKCPREVAQRVSVVSVGAVEVTLPCRCSLQQPTYNLTMKPRLPCDENNSSYPRVVQLLPVHWLNEQKLGEFEALLAKNDNDDALKVLNLTEDDFDLDISTKGVRSGVDPNASISGGVKFLLTLYFILILILLTITLFLLYLLKSVGVSANPLKIDVGYKNLRNHGLLSNEQCNE